MAKKKTGRRDRGQKAPPISNQARGTSDVKSHAGSPGSPRKIITFTATTAAQRILEALAHAWPAERIIEKLEELSNAERVYPTKDGDTYTTPDTHTQLAALKFIFEAVVGRSTPRPPAVVPPPEQPLEARMSSKLYRDALRKALDAADEAEAADRAPIEVEMA